MLVILDGVETSYDTTSASTDEAETGLCIQQRLLSRTTVNRMATNRSLNALGFNSAMQPQQRGRRKIVRWLSGKRDHARRGEIDRLHTEVHVQ